MTQPEKSTIHKLYILVDGSLPPGLQMAQVGHAAFDLALHAPGDLHDWHRWSNFLVVLASDDLTKDAARVQHLPGIRWMSVFEPDLPGCPRTAIAFVPDERIGPLLSELPLAGKERTTI